MATSPETALVVAIVALAGVVLNVIATTWLARKRAQADEEVVKLKAGLDLANASELAKVQADHTERLKMLEFSRTKTVADDSRRRKADAETLDQILTALRPEGVMSFLRDHDFGGSFNPEMIKPLYCFVDEAKRPDREFLFAELEELRLTLVAKGRLLSSLVAMKTHRRHGGYQSVLPDSLVNVPLPKHVDDAAVALNAAATEFVDVYNELVRKARSEVQGAHE